MTKRKPEEDSSLNSTMFTLHTSTPVLGTIIRTCLSSLLLVLFSCSDITKETSYDKKIETISFKSPGQNGVMALDVLTFDDDELMRVDSYQKMTYVTGTDMTLHSRTGPKIIFACANSHKDIYDWAAISSFQSIDKVLAELRKESFSHRTMSGVTYAYCGSDIPRTIELTPITSEVRIRSICCDFSGTSYSGEKLTDAKVYLTNLNCLCPINAEGSVNPLEIINAGGLNEDDLDLFDDPDIILRELGDIGTDKYRPDIRLLCYPSAGKTDNPGSPFTRLVIEGKIEGRTFWWPININRNGETDEEGIYRNRQYVFDIMIRRKGNDDPDMPIDINQAEIRQSSTTWIEKDKYYATF